MRSGNKIIVAIIVMLIILMLAGGAFAYVYIATDILKSDQELFFKYFAQITAEENGFFDNRIDTFYEKKTQTAYENAGEVTAKVEYPNETMAEIIGKVNELAVRVSGKVDSVNQKVQQNIEIDYGNDVILPINYRQDGNTIAFQSDELAKKYIAVRNENLKQLATNLGIQDVSQIPNKIEATEEIQGFDFTTEEIENLKQIYGTVLQQNILEENFSTIKKDTNETYTLELSGEQLKNIVIGMLEATTQNTLIIDKTNELLLSIDSNADKLEASEIESLIESIKEQDTSDIPSLKLSLVQNNKQLNQIVIELGESKVSIQKNNATDSLTYNINCEIKETVEDSDTNSILEEETSVPGQVNIYFNVQYKGLDNLTNVQENYDLGFEVGNDEDVMKYAYQINTNTEFNESISIDELDNSVAIFLNDYDETQLTPFLTQVGIRLLAINKNQMTELGLEEYENPLLYTNPITMLGLTIYNEVNNTIPETNLSQFEMTAFNEKFTPYVGEERKATEVNMMIATVKNSALSSAGSKAHLIKVTLDGVEILENVDSSKTYNVEAVYDTEGYVIEMKVTTNN